MSLCVSVFNIILSKLPVLPPSQCTMVFCAKYIYIFNLTVDSISFPHLSGSVLKWKAQHYETYTDNLFGLRISHSGYEHPVISSSGSMSNIDFFFFPPHDVKSVRGEQKAKSLQMK